MKKPLVRIVPAKGGYMVKAFGENGEMLSSSEILTTKENAFKNVGAQQRAFDSTSATIVLDESTNTKYLVYESGRKVKL